jgi:hypothetical protein
MDNKEKSVKDCGCNSDCCKPEKKLAGWKLWISVLVLAAAIAVIAFKLAGNHAAAAAGKEPVSACDTTKGAACDTTKSSSCCPK